MTELTLKRAHSAADATFDRLLGVEAGGGRIDRAAAGLGAQTRLDIEWQLVSDTAGFDALETEWTQLFEDAAGPGQVFQSYNWCWHWTRHYLPGGSRPRLRLAVVTGRLAGRLVLVLPLAVERRAGLRHLVWLGEPVSQYGDVIAAPEAADPAVLAAAWAFAATATKADVANLRKVRSDSLAARLMRQIGTTVTAAEEAPWIDLARWDTFEAFEEALPGKGRRKNRRRQMRRLEDRGPVTFEIYSGGDMAAQIADYAVRLKRVWLKSRDYISPALADERFAAFFSDVAHGRGRPAGVKVVAIRSNNEIAALDIVVDCKGSRFLHVAVFVPKFEKTGAGALLLENAIARSYDDGIATFDLLAPKHDYKLDYTESTVVIADHALALSLRGRVWTGGFLSVRRRLKHVVETMPAPARRALAAGLAMIKRGPRAT